VEDKQRGNAGGGESLARSLSSRSRIPEKSIENEKKSILSYIKGTNGTT